MTRLEQDIIDIFVRDASRAYSINQIASTLKKKYPYVHKTVTFLLKQNILTKQIIGRSFLCSLNFSEPKAVFLAALEELKKRTAFLNKLSPADRSAYEAVLILAKQHPVKCMLYGNGLYYAIVRSEDKPRLTAALGKMHTLTVDEAKQLLLNDHELLQKHIVIYSFEGYGELLADIQDTLRARALLGGLQ